MYGDQLVVFGFSFNRGSFRMPMTSPVAEWLATPRQTRSIGGVYVEDAPYQYMAALDIPNSFDVLLFVGNTTAVRKVE